MSFVLIMWVIVLYLPPAGKVHKFIFWRHMSSVLLANIRPSGSDNNMNSDVTAKMSSAFEQLENSVSYTSVWKCVSDNDVAIEFSKVLHQLVRKNSSITMEILKISKFVILINVCFFCG